MNEVTNYFMRRGTPVSACLLDCSKAFDKCRFDVLFKKLVNKGLPPIVIRLLVFVYEKQYGCVKLGGKRSDQFHISNGTRQGSVLSPLLFSVYLDGYYEISEPNNLAVTLGDFGWGLMDMLMLSFY